MTTIATQPAVTVRRSSAPGLGRLTRVELRKTVDTRSGRWLLLGVALIGMVTATVSALTGDAKDHTFHNMSATVQGAMSILLPVLSILLVTSEFSQRTAVQTFVLTPRRGRIVTAKLAAGSLIALTVAGFGVAVTALATSLAGTHPAGGTWQHAGTAVVGSVLVQLISQLSGMGFGLLLMSSAGAIVANFVIPIAWAALAGGIHALHGVQPWLDPSKVSTSLLQGEMTPHRWSQVGVVVLVWVVALVGAGAYRMRRHEIA